MTLPAAMPAGKTTEHCEAVLDEIERVVVGKRSALTLILIAVLARGHVLIEDLPGLGKTLIARSFAAALGLRFTRVQFTPDLLPADLLGSTIYDMQSGRFAFRAGPIFTTLLLADEINRTPPKTQAALLEAMQERQVTVGRVRHALSDPFFVLATQNPIEQEGTYPLPEAQQDRFMFKVFVKYPDFKEEFEVARRTTTTLHDTVEPVMTAAEILELQRIVREVPAADHVIRYALAVVRQTRVREPGVPEFVKDQLAWGAGPRAVQFLILGGKARALLQGRTHVTCDDIQALAKPVLRHRLVLTFTAESEGASPDQIVDRILTITPTREDELTGDARFQKIFAS